MYNILRSFSFFLNITIAFFLPQFYFYLFPVSNLVQQLVFPIYFWFLVKFNI